MTKSKSKRKTATGAQSAKTAMRKSSKRAAPVRAASAAVVKARAGSKSSQVLAMLRNQAGTTISAIMAATNWQQHSVRGFLTAVVRKKLGLNLVSEPNEGGRVYRIVDMPTKRAQQAA